MPCPINSCPSHNETCQIESCTHQDLYREVTGLCESCGNAMEHHPQCCSCGILIGKNHLETVSFKDKGKTYCYQCHMAQIRLNNVKELEAIFGKPVRVLPTRFGVTYLIHMRRSVDKSVSDFIDTLEECSEHNNRCIDCPDIKTCIHEFDLRIFSLGKSDIICPLCHNTVPRIKYCSKCGASLIKKGDVRIGQRYRKIIHRTLSPIAGDEPQRQTNEETLNL